MGSVTHLDSIPRIALQEELRIGSVGDPDAGFSRIGRVAVDKEGTIYVVEGRDREIRAYDKAGKLIRRIGKAGDGPGEFRSIGEIGILGDTLWAGDGSARRITLFRTDGTLIGTWRSPQLTVTPGPGIEVTLRGLRLRSDRKLDGVFAALSYEDGARNVPMTLPRVVFDTTGTIVDTIGQRPFQINPQFFDPVKIATQTVTLPEPPAMPEFVESTESFFRLLTIGGEAVSTTGELHIARTTFAGDTIFTRKFAYSGRSYPAGFIDSMATEFAKTYRSSQPIAPDLLSAAVKEHTKLPAFQPPILAVISPNNEWLWLQTNLPSDTSESWLVLEPDGTPHGKASLPPGAQVKWASREIIWAAVMDSLDVPFLIRYRVLTTR